MRPFPAGFNQIDPPLGVKHSQDQARKAGSTAQIDHTSLKRELGGQGEAVQHVFTDNGLGVGNRHQIDDTTPAPKLVEVDTHAVERCVSQGHGQAGSSLAQQVSDDVLMRGGHQRSPLPCRQRDYAGKRKRVVHHE